MATNSRSKTAPKRQNSPSFSDPDSENIAPAIKKKRNVQNIPIATIIQKLDERKQNSDALKLSVEKVERNVEECRDTIKNSLEELKSEFGAKLSNHDDRIVELEAKSSSLDEGIKRINMDQEKMYITINKLNLILLSLEEPRNESPEVLMSTVRDALSVINDRAIYDIKKVYRIGKPNFDHKRPVKLIFGSLDAREAIYDGRKSLSKPLILCEDLPFVTRMDHKKLLKFRHDALKSSPKELIMLQLQKRQIIIGNKLIKIVHGEWTEETLSASQIRKMQPRKDVNQGAAENERNHHASSGNQLSPPRSTTHLFGGTSRQVTNPQSIITNKTPESIRQQPDLHFLDRANQPMTGYGSMNPWMKS